MDATRIAESLVAMQARSLLVIGDVMLDRYIDGRVTRMSPEAPVPVLEKSAESDMPGGAANVACNLAALGCDVRLLAVTGDDAAGDRLASLLGSNLAIDFARICDPDRPTTRKTRFRSDGQQVLRVDEELTASVSDDVQARLLDSVKSQLATVNAVILSDYAKGGLPVSLMQQIIAAANDAGIPVIADPKQSDFGSYAGASLLTPNLAELRAATGLVDDDLEAIANATSTLAATHSIDAILATLSARGMLLSDAAGDWQHAPAEAREVFDVSGAGDTVVAMLAACVAAGIAHQDALPLANLAAGVVVGKSGTAVASPGEIISAGMPGAISTSWADAADACETWRKSGQSVGFTNGCFDMLHPGHFHLLASAAGAADRLVVGINSV
ncbi:MAG TPA: D-glycero-beta-D-manno-heptose-7-phosphate kinase, partial [Alphaproteobacteria bacterium]|nr:D-glycero-beta-D-manno-heptose-7-phosphate kinase [Alphaproteobacteria bacterium]